MKPVGSLTRLLREKEDEERFHLMSRPQYWCTKTLQRLLCWTPKPIRGIGPLCYVITFCCSDKFAKLLTTWMKMLYSQLEKSSDYREFELSRGSKPKNENKQISKWDGEGQFNYLKLRFGFILIYYVLFCFSFILNRRKLTLPNKSGPEL